MKGALYGPGLGASVPSARSLFTSALHHLPPPAREEGGCAQLAGSYATEEHCVTTEPLPGTHYRCVRYGGAIFVSAEQTGISSARINHFTGRGFCVLLPHASWLMFVVVSSDRVKSKTRRAAGELGHGANEASRPTVARRPSSNWAVFKVQLIR